MLSRYLSHALVLAVAIGIGAYAAPGASALHARVFSNPSVATAFASSGAAPVARLTIAPAGCQAPPAIPLGASLEQLGALQSQVQTRIDGCAARIEAMNVRLARLDRTILAEDQRISTERSLLAGLARDLYRRPQSVLVALATSRSLGDFLTGVADMQSAGARARQLADQMQADESQLRMQRAEIDSTRREQAAARASLQAAASRLQQLQQAALASYAAAPEPAYAFAIPPGRAAVIQDIENAFNPQGQYAVNWALRVAKCESNYNPNAVNPYSGTEGLFQFEPSTWRGTPYGRDNVFDPKYNSLAAAWLYSRDGGSPWQCS